jgi:hypothetical protein
LLLQQVNQSPSTPPPYGGKALLDLGINTTDRAYSMVTQSDGKILIAGETTALPAKLLPCRRAVLPLIRTSAWCG